jgi:hypothetical protein
LSTVNDRSATITLDKFVLGIGQQLVKDGRVPAQARQIQLLVVEHPASSGLLIPSFQHQQSPVIPEIVAALRRCKAQLLIFVAVDDSRPVVIERLCIRRAIDNTPFLVFII